MVIRTRTIVMIQVNARYHFQISTSFNVRGHLTPKISTAKKKTPQLDST